MSLLARVVEERHDDVSLAALEGELDASNVRAIGERLRQLLTNRSAALVLDLTATTYLDSAGINMLFELAGALADRQQQLRLVVPPATPLRRTLAIAGVPDAIPTHATRAAALARPG